MKKSGLELATINLSHGLLLTRRRSLQTGIAAAVSLLIPGCGSSSPSTSTPPITPLNSQPIPTGTITQASLTVTASSLGTIGTAFAGLSYEKSALYEPLFSGTNTPLIGLFTRIGTSLLRIGGNSVDKNVWNPSGAGQTSGQIAPADVDALAAFLKATGWQCLYGINLGGSATGVQTTALAAAEVAYVAQKLGSSLAGIEIGNEPDLYGDSGNYYAGAWSLSAFLSIWKQYRTAILATTPAVTITGPADASSYSTWTIPFGQNVTKSDIALLTQHYYRGDGQSASSTAANLITADSTLVNELAGLKTGAAGIGLPFRIAECNSYYNGGASGVSNSYASSLWVLDYLFYCALGGAAGVNFHGGGNGTGYTPIADSNGAVAGARPEFYGILLFTLAGQGTLYSTSLTTGSLNVTAYAVKTSSGGLNLIVVNKDSSQNLQLTMQLPASVQSATLMEMTQTTSGVTGPTLTATTGVTIQGASVGISGSFTPSSAYTLTTSGSQVTCYVPYLSAVLIQTT